MIKKLLLNSIYLHNFIFWVYILNIVFSRTYVATPASSWIDDYFDWISAEQCCMNGIINIELYFETSQYIYMNQALTKLVFILFCS